MCMCACVYCIGASNGAMAMVTNTLMGNNSNDDDDALQSMNVSMHYVVVVKYW